MPSGEATRVRSAGVARPFSASGNDRVAIDGNVQSSSEAHAIEVWASRCSTGPWRVRAPKCEDFCLGGRFAVNQEHRTPPLYSMSTWLRSKSAQADRTEVTREEDPLSWQMDHRSNSRWQTICTRGSTCPSNRRAPVPDRRATCALNRQVQALQDQSGAPLEQELDLTVGDDSNIRDILVRTAKVIGNCATRTSRTAEAVAGSPSVKFPRGSLVVIAGRRLEATELSASHAWARPSGRTRPAPSDETFPIAYGIPAWGFSPLVRPNPIFSVDSGTLAGGAGRPQPAIPISRAMRQTSNVPSAPFPRARLLLAGEPVINEHWTPARRFRVDGTFFDNGDLHLLYLS